MARNIALRPEPEGLAHYVATDESARVRELAYVGRFWDAIKTHRKVFSSVAIGFVLLTAIVSILTPKQYTAVAKLIVGGTPNQAASQDKATGLPVLNALALQSADLSSDTFAELMQEGPVADQVISKLNLSVGRERLLNRVAVKPVLNTALPIAISHSAGATDSMASAPATSALPAASSRPAGTRASSRPVATLETAEAATPAASTIPRAPTGSWMLIRIVGHSIPKVDPGSATPR